MSRYDDPSWYEEQNTNPPLPPPPLPGSSNYRDINTYPSYSISEDDPAHQRQTQPPRRNVSHRPGRLFGQAFLLTALLIITFLGGWFGNQLFGSNFNASDPSKAYSQLFDQAWSLIDKNFVDRKAVDYKSMSYSAIQAMVDSLHDTGHTRFLTPEQVQAENQQLSGTFTGIGIYLAEDTTTKLPIITSTIAGSPAEKAGIRHNDLILSVNGTSTAGKDLAGVTKLLQGKVDTSVSISVLRPRTQQTLIFHITRAEFTVQNVIMHYIAEDHIAQIRLDEFDRGVTDQLKTALTKAKSLGATKIILDLRDNPGGYLDEAINTASQFLKSGNVVLVKDSSGQTPMAVTGSPLDTTSELVVLVNKGTASAAEIVSGALQDNKRAFIMGEQTFGTGTVLQQYSLADGSAILIGTQEWLTPNGHFIRDHGIMPNTVVAMGADSTILMPNDENLDSMTKQQILASSDTQLVAAIKYLETH